MKTKICELKNKDMHKKVDIMNNEADIMNKEALNVMSRMREEIRCAKLYKELEETVHLMLSDDYKDRFMAEYRQTKIRYERLKKFCNRIEAAMSHPGKVEMPKHDCDLKLLLEQQKNMELYLHALEIRAVVEHIDL